MGMSWRIGELIEKDTREGGFLRKPDLRGASVLP